MASSFNPANSPKGFHVKYIDNIAVLVLNNVENRLNITSVQQFMDALDQVERNSSAKALIITGVGKFFSNGLDLAWLSKQTPDTAKKFFEKMREMNVKLVTFPMPTIAAINGHAFAAGCLIVMQCDCLVMRKQRGWLCLPEVQLKLRFSSMMMDIIKLKAPSPQVARDMVIYGKRYTAEEAYKVGLVDAICDQDDLIDCAVKMAKDNLGKNGLDRDMVRMMKMDLYGNTLANSVIKEAKASDKSAPGSLQSYQDAGKSKL